MRKLISIGLIVAILVSMIVSSLASGMPSDPIPPPPPPSSIYSTTYFFNDNAGVITDGYVRAYEAPYRQVKLKVCASKLGDYDVGGVELVVAMWSGDDDDPVLYRTHVEQEDIVEYGDYYDITIRVRKDDVTESPKWGLAYFVVTRITPGNVDPYYKVYAIKFIDGAAPEIYYQTGTIVGLWNMLTTRFQSMPAYYGN